ncbi:MAG: PD-(D/E)XK nuclease family protein [Candidatus Aenigmarchaeota archaeon]|nr:PD-(D/E)XK nuclease family protein [Candidatus Aenigmarchaeota archaeon]
MIDFDEMIDNYIYRESRPPEIGRYWPSMIGACIRKVWYTYKHPKQIDPELQKIFEMGNIMHNFVVEVLKSEKNPHVTLVDYERPLKIEKKDYTISGRVDDIIMLKRDGKLILIEVKSHKNVDFVKEPARSHKMQLMFYMHVSGIHNGILLYIDKNNMKTKSFEINYKKEEAEKVLKRFYLLDKYLKNDELPVAEAKYEKDIMWMCKFCEYKDKCKKDEK